MKVTCSSPSNRQLHVPMDSQVAQKICSLNPAHKEFEAIVEIQDWDKGKYPPRGTFTLQYTKIDSDANKLSFRFYELGRDSIGEVTVSFERLIDSNSAEYIISERDGLVQLVEGESDFWEASETTQDLGISPEEDSGDETKNSQKVSSNTEVYTEETSIKSEGDSTDTNTHQDETVMETEETNEETKIYTEESEETAGGRS